MSKTNSFETSFLELLLNNNAIANIGDASGLQPSGTDGSLYVALTTSTPSDSTNGTEANYTGYAREAIARTTGGWTVSGNNASNAVAVVFGECTAGGSTVTHFEIWTAATGGTRLFWGALDSNLAITTGITPEFAIGALDINED